VSNILDVKELAMYIVLKYKEDFNKDISSVKLNKVLYFCFAYWGSYIIFNKDFMKDSEVPSYSEILFDSKIEAWIYGAAIPEVYYLFVENKLNEYYNKDLFNEKDYLKEYLDEILEDLLDISDFRLVEIAHQDKCWKKNWNYKYIDNSKEINKKDIIKEYIKKYI